MFGTRERSYVDRHQLELVFSEMTLLLSTKRRWAQSVMRRKRILHRCRMQTLLESNDIISIRETTGDVAPTAGDALMER